MPIGEIIGEMILRPILELVLYGLSYWTGFVVLKTVSIGTIRLAPLLTIQEKNRGKRKWYQVDWGIWLHRPMQGRALKAECTCLVGLLVWVAVGFGIYLGTREDKATANKPAVDNAEIAPRLVLGHPLARHA
ncbi:MAG: hypothetical protein C4576_13325 [Desulfobacteraceae bacterium]|nr:MAG: hypothetical protein C4576_13325 [Desulfobacteraceae bacterium]